MDFFHIDTERCGDCHMCFKVCPVNAIEVTEQGRRIIHEKCIACGKCYKECTNYAVTLTIPIDRINLLEEHYQKTEQYEGRIDRLEKENLLFRKEYYQWMGKFRDLIQKLPVAAVITDRDNRIRFTNNMFIDMLDFRSRQLCDTVPGLIGIELSEVTSKGLNDLFIHTLQQGRDILNTDVLSDGNILSISTYCLKNGDLVLGLIRNLYDKEIVKEELINRINEVMDRNMAMVQKIGFLLGEEASETTKILHSIIHSIE